MSKTLQNIIVFIDTSDARSDRTPEKIARSYMNRFAIIEDPAFEVLSVHYDHFGLTGKKAYINAFNKAIHTAAYEISISDYGDSEPHLIFGLNYCLKGIEQAYLPYQNSVNLMSSEYLVKKFKMSSLMITCLTMTRRDLITKEKMEAYPEGRENLKKSVHDDLDDFVEKVRLGKKIKAKSKTYYLPKLTETEKNLVKCRDINFMDTLSKKDPDNILQQMKTSESNSIYVNGECVRQTYYRKQSDRY